MTGASYFITAHNHPGGDAMPSREDVDVVKDLRTEFGEKCIDALIIADRQKSEIKYSTYSFDAYGYFDCNDMVDHFHSENEIYLAIQINDLKRKLKIL